MDTEKIELYVRLWHLGTAVYDGLKALEKNPEDVQVLVDTQAGFQALKPYLSDNVSDMILHIFSGAEITSEDLLKTSQQLLNGISDTISKALVDLLKDHPFVERSEAEKLFLLWDEIPHSSSAAYQWLFDLCAKASLSMPLEAFRYSLRIFEDQPKILSGQQTPHPGYVYRPSKQRTFEQCPICGDKGTPYFRAFSYRMADFAYPDLPVKLWMKCLGCKNLYTWQYPEESLNPKVQRKMISPNHTLTAVENTSGGSLAIWADILNHLSLYTSGKDLLEVGIGKGELLAVALELGYQPDAVELVERTAQKVADTLDISIWCGDFLDYRPNKAYSVITMGDVIEHVTKPEKALQSAYRLLKEDGVLWLSTPNFESSFSRMLKFNDPMWLEPHHVTYFSRDGLEALAAKCGFVLREYNVSRRYNGSMELIFTKRTAEQRIDRE